MLVNTLFHRVLGGITQQTIHSFIQVVIYLLPFHRIFLHVCIECRLCALYDACVLKDMLVTTLDLVPSLVECTDLSLDLISPACVQGYNSGLWFGITHCQ